MKIPYKIYFAFTFFLFPLSVLPQVNTDSLNFFHNKFRQDVFRTTFDKRLNTYNLRSKLDYSTFVNNFFIGLNEDYLSSVVKSSNQNIKDEQFLSVFGEYKFSPSIQIGTLTQNSIYSNDRKIAINEASILHSTLYGKLLPIPQLVIVPYGGYSINKQVNEDDRGLIYGTNLNLDKYKMNDFIISSKIKFQSEDISPRKNSYQFANAKILNNINPNLTNIIAFNYSNTRKDFYFNADSLTSILFNISKNIQSRTEKRYFIEERLFNSRYASDLFFDLSGKISMRNIDRNTKYKNLSNINISTFDTAIEEFRVDITGTSEYRSQLFFGKLKLDYSEREEKHKVKKINEANPIFSEQRDILERKKNNNSEYFTISAIGNFNLSASDNIGLSLLHRKLIYNTPSQENFDDRDELLSIFRISYFKKITHLFDYFLHLEGSINHLVYIFAERSSNNNVRRIIKLSTGGTYKTKKLYSKNTFEVSANYTSYDFEDINPNIRSFSFRQLGARDSSSISIFNKIHLNFSGYVKLSEQGDFAWSNFSNSPNRFLAEYYAEPTFSLKKEEAELGVGIRFFSLQTFGYNKNNYKYLKNKYTSIGPITTFILRMRNLDIYIYGWYEFINNEKNNTREMANATISINWKL